LRRSLNQEFTELLNHAKEAVKRHVASRPDEAVHPAIKAAVAAPLKSLRLSQTLQAVDALQEFCEEVEDTYVAKNARGFALGVSEELVGFVRSRRLEVQAMFEGLLEWCEVQALGAEAARVLSEFEAKVKAEDPGWMLESSKTPSTSIAAAVERLDALRGLRDALDVLAKDGCVDAVKEKAELSDTFKAHIRSLSKFVVNFRIEKLTAWLAEFVGDVRGQIDKKTLRVDLESAAFSDAEVFALLHASFPNYRMWRENLVVGVTVGYGGVRDVVRGFEGHEHEVVSGLQREVVSYQEARRVESRSEKLESIINTISQILADKQFLRDKTRLVGCLTELRDLVGREHDTFRNTVQLVKRGINQLQEPDHLSNLIAAENYNQLVETVVVLQTLTEEMQGFLDVDAANVYAQVEKFANRILNGALSEMEGSVREGRLSEFNSLRLVSTLSPTLRSVFPRWLQLEREVRDRGLAALRGNIDEVVKLMRNLKPEEEHEEGKLVYVARLLVKGFAVATQIKAEGFDAVETQHHTPSSINHQL